MMQAQPSGDSTKSIQQTYSGCNFYVKETVLPEENIRFGM